MSAKKAILSESFVKLAAFYIVCVLSLFFATYRFTFAIGQTTEVVKDSVVLLTDSMLLLSGIWIIGPRFRWTACLAIAVCVFFIYANLLYFRYWHDIIPFHTIISVKSYNSLVFQNVPGLITLSDAVYLLFVCIPIAAYRLLSVRNTPPVKASHKAVVVTVIFLMFATAQILATNAIKNYIRTTENSNYTFLQALDNRFTMQSNRVCMWKASGLAMYSLVQVCHIPDYRKKVLAPDQRRVVESFINSRQSVGVSSAFSGNRNHNLILIIVESLNSGVIDARVNGVEVTPILNRLVRDHGTISCVDVVSQVKDGGSSDGQMIYNTGLLPINNGCAALIFGDNTFPSLVSSLKPSSAKEIIAEAGYIWNHDVTSESYGYDELIQKVGDSRYAEEHGHDAALFKRALDEIPKMPQPYLLEITSLSMHKPFMDKGASFHKNLTELNGISAPLANYYRMTNYFDTQLGMFVDELKRMRLYDNTIIVIASDHNTEIEGVENSEDSPIVFMALNTGESMRIDRTVGQIDVFPTILDVMGCENMSWRGVGISMLDQDNSSAVDADGNLIGRSSAMYDRLKAEAWDVSDLIIRSDYFSDPGIR